MGPIMQARVSPAAAVAIYLLVAAHHLEGTVATASGGYEYLGFGGCRDNNGSVYSNIRLTDATATRDDSSCGQSCDVFRSSGTLRGFEWLIVNGSSKRCYCLFDAGSDVETMALEKGGDGATWKGDNEGTGEISSVENVGIDSYCHKLVSIMKQSLAFLQLHHVVAQRYMFQSNLINRPRAASCHHSRRFQS